MAEIWHKTCQKQALFTSFRDSAVIFRIYFLTDFDASKSVLGSFFAFFAKIWPINMHHTSKSRIFCWTFFTWWPEMTFTFIMVTKHSKWYLQMSETLSMPISWLCLCLTSQFCSPMSPSPKNRTFSLWPDLWCDQWPLDQISHHVWKLISRAGLSDGVWILEIGPVVWEITGGMRPPKRNVWLTGA